MGRLPDVDDAYNLSSPDAVKDLYRAWAQSYDTGFGEAQGYQLPFEVAKAYVAAGGAGPVLDVGAGTGLVGGALQHLNVGPVDGIDLSEEMLAVAAAKGCYRDLDARDITQTIDLPGAPYQGIVSAGTFTLGHVGPDALQNLLPLAGRGAVFVISVNVAHFDGAGFAAAFSGFGGAISDLQMRDVRIYDDRADAAHRNDMARLVTFRCV